MNKIRVISILVIVAMASSCYAGIDNTVGARGEGMGFSYGAIAAEPFGALYNPANIAFVQGWQTQFQYMRPTHYGFAIPSESPYAGLAGINYYRQGLGNIALNINQIGSTSSPTTVTTTTSAVLSYARLLSPNLSAGASGRYILETNFGERKAFDLDVGLNFRPAVDFAIAASGENLVKSKLSPDWTNTPEHLNRKMRLTGAWLVPTSSLLGSFMGGWQMTQSGESETINTSLINLASEWWIGTNSNISFGVRGGYTFGKANLADEKTDYKRWHGGMSLNFNMAGRDLRFDYGLRTYPFEGNDELNADHFLSVSYGFGGVPDYGRKKEEPSVATSKIYETAKPLPPVVAPPPAPPAAVAQLPPAKPAEVQVEPAPAPAVEQPPMAPSTGTEPAVINPEQKSQTPVQDYLKLDLGLDVSDINLAGDRRIIFFLRPMKVVKLTSWQFYIFKARLKTWSEEKAESFSLHKVEGKGIPPINVIWNGLLNDGMMMPSGKYFFIIAGEDKFGQRYISEWCKFTLN